MTTSRELERRFAKLEIADILNRYKLGELRNCDAVELILDEFKKLKRLDGLDNQED